MTNYSIREILLWNPECSHQMKIQKDEIKLILFKVVCKKNVLLYFTDQQKGIYQLNVILMKFIGTSRKESRRSISNELVCNDISRNSSSKKVWKTFLFFVQAIEQFTDKISTLIGFHKRCYLFLQ